MPFDLMPWCERIGLSDIDDVREIRAGRSGSRVVVLTAAGVRVVLKVTTDPGRLERARHEVEVLHELGRHPVRCAPGLVGAASTPDGVAVALEHATPLPAPDRMTDRDWVDVAVTIAAVHELPGTLEHGDCHLDNLVRDATGRVLLVDWQEARVGDGLADLVFVWQRAEFAGGRPPRDLMTSTYAAARGLEVSTLAPLLDRTELRLLREDWPPFLPLGDDAGRTLLAERLAMLTHTIDAHDDRPA